QGLTVPHLAEAFQGFPRDFGRQSLTFRTAPGALSITQFSQGCRETRDDIRAGRPLAAFQHPNDFAKTRTATVGGIGSGRSLGAASKCEHWRCIDLADLKRMGLLKPIVNGRIRAITWKNDQGGLDKLGIIPSAKGIQFVKRDDEGKLAGLFVAYTHTP